MAPSSAPGRRDVWVLAADSGCGACMQSFQALQSPRYANLLREHGVRFAGNRRQADVILLTGALPVRTRAPLGRLLAEVPRPRALVAVGDCAIAGCVFRGSAALVMNPADALDVNAEIAGCPPAPTAILDAIVAASHLLALPPKRLMDRDRTAMSEPDTKEFATERPVAPALQTARDAER